MRLLVILLVFFSSHALVAQDHSPRQVMDAATYKSLPAKEKGILVDVRTPAEYQAGHLKKALNSDFRGGQFSKEFTGWDKDKTYYLYCASGNRSGQALKQMQTAGFTNVINLGAYKDLKAAGLKTKEEKPASSKEAQ